MIVDGGQWTVSGGTSASGPIWNGITTCVARRRPRAAPLR